MNDYRNLSDAEPKSLSENDVNIIKLIEKALPNMSQKQKAIFEGVAVAVSMFSDTCIG